MNVSPVLLNTDAPTSFYFLRSCPLVFSLGILTCLLGIALGDVEFNRTPTDEQLAFFESKIRPVLIEHCYECHSTTASEVGGGLLLDSQRGIVQGGDTSPSVVPRDAEASLIMTAIKYNKADLQMPPSGKLADHQIQDIKSWIEMGAPDPRTEDTVAVMKAKKAIDWDKARDFWSLRPIARPAVPEVDDSGWEMTNIDRFLLAGMKQNSLEPSTDASREVWIRRATYDLTGLPPTIEDIDTFVGDRDASAYAKVVDRLLPSHEYGERWGRHWLDVAPVRVAAAASSSARSRWMPPP